MSIHDRELRSLLEGQKKPPTEVAKADLDDPDLRFVALDSLLNVVEERGSDTPPPLEAA